MCCLPSVLFAQRHPIGTFFSHLPYQRSFQLAEVGGRVYCHAGPSLFSYDLDTEEIERWNKITGMSDMGVAAIAGDDSLGLLFVGYENGNMDLIKDNEIINFEDLRRANIVADRSINHFHFSQGQTFISTGFGLLVFDNEKQEFSATYLIGPNESYVSLNASFVYKDTIYCSTEEGLFYAGLNEELEDFRVWKRDTNIVDPQARYNHIFSFNDSLFINKPNPAFRTDSVYFKNGSTWEYYPRLSNETNYSIRANASFLSIAQTNSASVFDNSWNQLRRPFDYGSGIAPSPRDALFDADSRLWIADFNQGLIRSRDDFNNDILTPDSPKSSNNFKVQAFGDKVVVAAGGVNDNWLNSFLPAEAYLLEKDQWIQLDAFRLDTLTTMFDILDIESSDEESYFFASYGDGLIQADTNRVKKVYNSTNSELQAIPEDSNYVAISGLFMDDSDNLWVGNGRSSKPLHCLSSTGEWYSFPIDGFNSTDVTGDIIKTSWGHIWMFLPKRGILVYDYNNTLEDVSDDRYRILNSSPNNGNLPSNELKAIVEDRSGSVWAGTNLGLRVFFNAASVLDETSVEADEILIQQDGFTEILFENDNITSIFVDQANRKWIGTQNSGAFLLSSDGKEQIHSFNEDNSPLFSNEVNSITVLESTGEVFIGTERGIIAYKADATAARNDYDQIYVYPNPVPQGHNGVIAVKNTTENALVKITDVSGNMIYETRSNGGQAVWNGVDQRGNKVATGVYLVYCSDSAGNLRGKTKLLYLR